MATTPSPTGLSLGQALQDGWQVFRRSPWPFVGFVLLSFGCNLALDWLPAPANRLTSGLINLWVSIGLMRGVWLGLQGKQPTFGDLIKLNPGATWRLFSRQFVLGLLLTLISGAAFALAVNAAQASPLVEDLVSLSVGADGSDPSQLPLLLAALQALGLQLLSSPVAMLLLLLGSVLSLYIQVNQAFLGYLAVMKGLGPIQALQAGFTTVQQHWWTVFGLLVLQLGVLALGFVACGFGLLAAVPVVSGLTASAYRQLFGDDDAAGFMRDR